MDIFNKDKIVNDIKENKNEILTEQEVFDVLEFAKSISSAFYSPDMVNSKLQQITTNPYEPEAIKITSALKNPADNEELLIGFSEFFEFNDMLFKRSLQYLGNLLSFDWTYSCTNAYDEEDYKSKEYKEDERKLKDFISKFNFKKEFKQLIRVMLKQETDYLIFRTDGLKYIFQQLPRKYCKITGKWEYGFLFDFNMEWFITQDGINLDTYPHVLQNMYNRVFVNKTNSKKYNPANKLNKRKGTFSYWTQTSPEDGFWCFKFNPDTYTNVPYFSAMFPDVVLKPVVRQLQTNQFMISAQKVMVGLIPFLEDVKGGKVKDSLAISLDSMGKFIGYLKQGLTDAIKVGGVPFSDIKVLDFKPNDSNMLEDYSKTTYGASGITSRFLYATDKMTATEVEYSSSIDEFIVSYIYPYFEDFVNYQLEYNDDIKTSKYKFQIKFEGTEFPNNKKTRTENTYKWASVGVVLPQKIAMSLGLNPFELESQMLMAKNNGFVDNLLKLASINTASDSGDSGKKVADNLNDSTIANKDNPK